MLKIFSIAIFRIIFEVLDIPESLDNMIYKIKYWTAAAVTFLSLLYAVDASAVNRNRQDRMLRERMESIKSLYDNYMYSAAKDEITRFLHEYGDVLDEIQDAEIATWSIICDIALSHRNIDGLMRAYEAEYADAPEYMRVRFLYGKHYFRQKDYGRALAIFETVEYALLPSSEKPEYIYEKSCSYMRTGQADRARTGFDNLLAMKKNPYTVPAMYYRGYIYYMDKDFKNAVKMLGSIRNHDRFAPFCEYYILESELMLGNYDYVIAKSSEVSGMVGEEMKPKVAKIVSQAYFKNGRSEDAREWFEKYAASGEKMTRKDNYFFGVMSYSLKSYIPAIDALLKVISDGAKDSLAQNAYLHIGNSYLNLKNKIKAIDAYKSAAMMDIPGDVREDSYFNYAKLAFDLNSDIVPFNEYLEMYPKSLRADEIYSYIATSYLLEKKYKSAINALNKIRRLTPEMDVNLQKAAFLRGMELLESGSYNGAITDFNISLKHSTYNTSLALLVKFWLAEAQYRVENYDEALKLNNALYENSRFRGSREYSLLLFNQGYCHFRKEDYTSAAEWFNRFLNQHYTNQDLIMETKVRMADSYFMMQNYDKSAALYEEVYISNYKSPYRVYAAYQGAISYGLVSKPEKKIEVLQGIMGQDTASPLYAAAVYELGRTYVQHGKSFNAEKCFIYLLEEVKSPGYMAKAMLELGMLYSNAGKYDEALQSLSGIVENMPLSEDTENALAVMESIYVTLNRPEDYLAYLERVGMSSLKTEDETEAMIFNAAERVYLSGNYTVAEKQLKDFVEKYPDSPKLPLAYFYLGETLLESGKKEAAAAAYTKVMDLGEGSFVEISTLKYAGICYELQKFEEAAGAYTELYSVARLENNRYEAVLGEMRSRYRGEKYQLAADAAERMLAVANIRPQDKMEADYVMAKSLLMLGRRDEAMPIVKELSANVFSPYGAESCYILIQEAFDSGQFEEVENKVYAFSDSQTNQTYWLAKSFIVLGDSFAEREEWEQAEATFRSIAEGYAPADEKDDVQDQIRLRLEKIKQMSLE